MSYKGINQHIEEIYVFRASPATMMATTTTRVGLPVCLDGCTIHYKVKKRGHHSKAVYTELTFNLAGKKEV
jgi:hypothetical protein